MHLSDRPNMQHTRLSSCRTQQLLLLRVCARVGLGGAGAAPRRGPGGRTPGCFCSRSLLREHAAVHTREVPGERSPAERLCLGEHTRRLVSDDKPRRQTIIFQLFSMVSLCSYAATRSSSPRQAHSSFSHRHHSHFSFSSFHFSGISVFRSSDVRWTLT